MRSTGCAAPRRRGGVRPPPRRRRSERAGRTDWTWATVTPRNRLKQGIGERFPRKLYAVRGSAIHVLPQKNGRMFMDLGIAGRKAIVCASSRGLGRGCAYRLAEAGCEVVVN